MSHSTKGDVREKARRARDLEHRSPSLEPSFLSCQTGCREITKMPYRIIFHICLNKLHL